MIDPILKIIADNPALVASLRKVITDEFEIDYVSGVDINKSNEDLGALLRARLDGLRKVEGAFKKIMQCKTPSENVDNKNPAR